MKNSEIRCALDALATMRISKISDKGIRNAIIEDHYRLLGAQKRYESELIDLDKACLGAYAEDRNAVADLQQRLSVETDKNRARELIDAISRHAEFLEAVKDFNTRKADLGNEEVTGLIPISHRDFLETLADIDFSLGSIEALYPLFKNDND